MSGAERVVGIGEFRQRATEIIREVETSAEPVAISRRGKPVVELRSLRRDPDDLKGSVVVASGVDLTEPVLSPDDWSAVG